MLILARVYRFFRCSAIWTTGPLHILTAAAHHYLCIWASHPEHNVGVWQQVCQFLQCLVLMVLNNSLKTSPLSPLDVFFPLPSPPHPSCILRSHLLLSSLSFLYPPSPFFCTLTWSVAPQGEVLGQIDDVQTWLCTALCTFLPLFLCALIPAPYLFSFIIHSSQLSSTASVPPTFLSFSRRVDAPSRLPLVPAFLFFFLPSSVQPFLPPRFLSLDRLIVFLFYRKTYKDLSFPWQH